MEEAYQGGKWRKQIREENGGSISGRKMEEVNQGGKWRK